MDQRLVATTLIRDTWIHTEETQVGPMWTDTRDTSVGKFIRDGIAWADGELAYLRAVVKPGMRVVDVGANVGLHGPVLWRSGRANRQGHGDRG